MQSDYFVIERAGPSSHLVFDERVLGEIPLERWRVFVLAESTATCFCHKSVADLVLALQPEGLRFIPADRWNDSAGFRS